MVVGINTQGRLAMQGLRRSFEIYYRDHERTARMDRLNAAFVGRGATVFDIGAHVGDRTGSFLRLGAEVVALEPQPLIFRALRRIYGRCPRATLLPCAVGDQTDHVDLLVNPSNPTVATATSDFVKAASGAPGWEDQVWDVSIKVPVTTLDALIDEYGQPDFVKIDVEGHEPVVLRGLSKAIPLLSFEVTTIYRSGAQDCIDRLSSLGRYEYNYSVGEEHALQYPDWVSPNTMRERIDNLPLSVNSGDVYARRCDGRL
ncbi:FkbM family methyltransferase [Ruegeria profundi]|uniref:FkbM family methyltransferase n=1 Tax=Ruegeria profundi TaxID=1685378 RepID=UPI001CD42EB1|nr:FkbM family methyltransferase [Ruegeria profundi]MCA0928429.1 FkbM family methyltransferase [Ruegeria profundi]